MPLYDYRCDTCNNVFELRLPMTDNILPTTKPCPTCNNYTIEQFLETAPGIADPMRIGSIRPPSEFRRDVLGRIKAANPGNTIGTRHFGPIPNDSGPMSNPFI